MEEFTKFRDSQGDVLDERYRREQALASTRQTIGFNGTCGVCVDVARFTSATTGGDIGADGRRVPNWREEQACSCRRRLNCRQRALLHLAVPRLNAGPSYRVAVVGENNELSAAVGEFAPDAAIWRRFERGGGNAMELSAPSGDYHLIVSADYLQHVPQFDAAVGEIARLLMPGGLFLFSVPFHFTTFATKSELGKFAAVDGVRPTVTSDVIHHFGWDLLDRVRAMGFYDCVAHCYWSEELGYLGPYNMVFAAFR